MKLVIAMICRDSEDFIGLSLRSVMPWADKIVIVDGGSKDKTLDIIEELWDERFVLIGNDWDDEDKGMDGKQRNKYLEYLIKNHKGDWCFVIDSDEVLHDNCDLHNACQKLDDAQYNVASPLMEHFIYDLKRVDNTFEKHFCPHRMFKVQDGNKYPEVEHNILQVPDEKHANVHSGVLLLHLGYIRGLFSVMNRYYKNLKKSNIHSEAQLIDWKNKHIMGTYPTREYTGGYPKVMRDYFEL